MAPGRRQRLRLGVLLHEEGEAGIPERGFDGLAAGRVDHLGGGGEERGADSPALQVGQGAVDLVGVDGEAGAEAAGLVPEGRGARAGCGLGPLAVEEGAVRGLRLGGESVEIPGGHPLDLLPSALQGGEPVRGSHVAGVVLLPGLPCSLLGAAGRRQRRESPLVGRVRARDVGFQQRAFGFAAADLGAQLGELGARFREPPQLDHQLGGGETGFEVRHAVAVALPLVQPRHLALDALELHLQPLHLVGLARHLVLALGEAPAGLAVALEDLLIAHHLQHAAEQVPGLELEQRVRPPLLDGEHAHQAAGHPGPFEHPAVALGAVPVAGFEEQPAHFLDRRAPRQDGEALLRRPAAGRHQGAGERRLRRRDALAAKRRAGAAAPDAGTVGDHGPDQGRRVGPAQVVLEAPARGEAGRVEELADGVEQRRLARAVGAGHQHHVAMERDVDLRPEVPAMEIEVEEAEHQPLSSGASGR